MNEIEEIISFLMSSLRAPFKGKYLPYSYLPIKERSCEVICFADSVSVIRTNRFKALFLRVIDSSYIHCITVFLCL